MKTRLIILSALIFIGQSVWADEGDTTKIAPFHFSFITPLGTNGMESWNTTNNFSVNMIAGYSGGLQGIEFAGFANALKGDMKGVQMAGFCNNTFGYAQGAEIAGFWNYNHKDVKGFQASGFANVTNGMVDGFQASGFANYAEGVSLGQFSGFANISSGKLYGVQATGFANIAGGPVKGVQGSGFANISTNDVFGVQGTGFANIVAGDLKGVQASGFTNVVTGRTEGLQATGFFNYTKKLKGVQVGVFNYADSVESGIPIGVFSFVKNGYLAMEVGGNESILASVSLKTGVEKFYNIISIGGSIRNDRLMWGWGYGIGTMLPVSNRMNLSIEAISYHLNEDAWWTNGVNLLNRASASISYELSSTFSVYAGPAINVWVTNADSDGNANTEAPFSAWNLYSRTKHRTEVSIYPGLSAGVRIRIN